VIATVVASVSAATHCVAVANDALALSLVSVPSTAGQSAYFAFLVQAYKYFFIALVAASLANFAIVLAAALLQPLL